MGKKNNYDRDLIIRNMSSIRDGLQVKSEEGLLRQSDTSNLSEHNEQYTTLLKAYVEDFEYNSKNKRKNKESLFKIAKGLLICVPAVTFVFMFATLGCLACGAIDVLESLPGIFTALASLIGTFMVIPQMITKYLFNKKEEEHLADIISKIQEYDRNIRGDL